MTPLRERKRLATRAAIIDAAKELFKKEGFDETSVDDIAAAALISKFTFYNFFESKDELLTELHLEILRSLAQNPMDSVGQNISVAQIFIDHVSQMANWGEENKELSRILIERSRFVFPAKTADNCLLNISELIRYGQNTGEFNKAIDPDDCARYAFALAHGEKRAWVDANCSYSLKEKFIDLAKFALLALRP